MKQYLFLVMFIAVTLAGCGSNEQLTFNGESKHWTGEYKTNIVDGDMEDGEYTFRFKDGKGKEEVQFDSLEIIINEDQSSTKVRDYSGSPVITVSNSCSGCSVTERDELIEVTIRWDGTNEETFELMGIQ